MDTVVAVFAVVAHATKASWRSATMIEVSSVQV